MRVFLSNLGCKLNQAELEDLARRFTAAGHVIAGSLAAADLHVVNTCTVTHVAARDSRKVARRGRRLNPALRTVVTGCWPAAAPDEAKGLTGVDLVVPNDAKHELVERVHRAFPGTRPAGRGDGPLAIPYVPLEFGNSRALVKVEDGCNMRCSFCIIPATRGRQRSRPLEEIVAEVAALAGGGFREIVVTGVQISAYRSAGAPEARLFELVAALLERTPVARLRLTSIAPWQFDRRLLALFASGRLCRHFHFSLQSGCDSTLERMRRPYSAARFAALIEEVRAAVPGVAITTDVIVGFPGESEREFEESLEFVRAARFARVHAFPYSPRPGTEAAAMAGRLAPGVVKERMRRMLEVSRASARRFRRRRLGETAAVLWERRREGRWRGTTDHYLRVVAEPGWEPVDRLAPARLESLVEAGVLARPLEAVAGPAVSGASGASGAGAASTTPAARRERSRQPEAPSEAGAAA